MHLKVIDSPDTFYVNLTPSLTESEQGEWLLESERAVEVRALNIYFLKSRTDDNLPSRGRLPYRIICASQRPVCKCNYLCLKRAPILVLGVSVACMLFTPPVCWRLTL
jgi:hypothetical protein